MIVTARGCWDSSKAHHVKYFDTVVAKCLAKYKARLTKKVHDFLVKEHAHIRDGTTTDFTRIQSEFNVLLATLSDKTKARVNSFIPKIYCYKSFQVKDRRKWCAYRLCQQAALHTCPYCNLSYGHTLIVDEEGKLRPSLDHFFDKARYPLFAISLGNLVPSCYHCNSSLKGTSDFLIHPHLNPLEDDEKLRITLDVHPLSARSDIKLLDTADIKIVYAKSTKEIQNSLKTFVLRERYQLLVEQARFITKSLQIYNEQPSIVPDSLSWILQGVRPDNYRNRTMGKMITDLFDEYGQGLAYP